MASRCFKVQNTKKSIKIARDSKDKCTLKGTPFQEYDKL